MIDVAKVRLTAEIRCVYVCVCVCARMCACVYGYSAFSDKQASDGSDLVSVTN